MIGNGRTLGKGNGTGGAAGGAGVGRGFPPEWASLGVSGLPLKSNLSHPF
jgi:hypothetical protein